MVACQQGHAIMDQHYDKNPIDMPDKVIVIVAEQHYQHPNEKNYRKHPDRFFDFGRQAGEEVVGKHAQYNGNAEQDKDYPEHCNRINIELL